MGAYLSEPVKEKVSEDGGDPRFAYGASAMQGWRISQEDAHNCILSLDEDTALALFAVYDGHGGAEVAQYTAQHFPRHISKEKQRSAAGNTSVSQILENAFLSFDQHLKQPAVLLKLRQMASGGGGEKPKKEGDGVDDANPKEARLLQKEASMPLEQILAKYVHHRANALLKERRRADGEEVSDDEDEGEDDEEDEEEDERDEEDEDEDEEDDEDEENGEDVEKESDEKKKKDEAQSAEGNGVVINGNHDSDVASAGAEADDDDDEKPAKKARLVMEEFGFKGASKCGKGGKGKGKKTPPSLLQPRVPIEASPAIQAKTESKAPKTESKLARADQTAPIKMDLEQQLHNGHSENENNENIEREQTLAINGANNTHRCNGDSTTDADLSTTPNTRPEDEQASAPLKTEKGDGESKPALFKEDKNSAVDDSSSVAKEETTEYIASNESDQKKENGETPAESVSTTGSKPVEEEPANAEESSAPTGAASTGSRRSRKAAPVRHVAAPETKADDSDDSEDDLKTKMMKDLQEPESDDSEDGEDELDGDDDEEDDDDEEEDDDDDDDDEDDADDNEEEADDEDDEDEDYEAIQGSGEEPGFDSGCTACVTLLIGNEMFVANVGDSRCVVCRAGEAVEMSFDHKPTDEIETNRITKAGGKVTEDGRVNGGLNLSRALGDHSYKNVSNLTDREQMISAQPDVKSMVLTPKDEFMVIACDGIWNSLTSQEVVDFVKMRIDHEKELTLSQICEELFDHCLAPHTMGDGTGCDNMTCIIVRFDSLAAMSSKRLTTEDRVSEDGEEPSGKRLKLAEKSADDAKSESTTESA